MQSIKAPDGWVYILEGVRCGKPNCKCAKGELHGPYWFKYRSVQGKTQKRYVGKDLPGDVLEGAAHKTQIRATGFQICPECGLSLGTDLASLDGMGGALYHKACIARVAAKVVLGFFDRGEEPLSGELAEALELDAAVLGRLLPKYGMPRPVNTTKKRGKGKVSGKFYTVDMKAQITAVLEGPVGVIEDPLQPAKGP